MKDQKRVLKLDDFLRRLLINCPNKARTLFSSEEKPIEDVDDLRIRAVKEKTKKIEYGDKR